MRTSFYFQEELPFNQSVAVSTNIAGAPASPAGAPAHYPRGDLPRTLFTISAGAPAMLPRELRFYPHPSLPLSAGKSASRTKFYYFFHHFIRYNCIFIGFFNVSNTNVMLTYLSCGKRDYLLENALLV